MQRILLLLVICFFSHYSFAQKDTRLAQGLSPIKNLPVERMPIQDNADLLREELARRGPGIAPRYASNINVDISPDTHGQWESTRDGMVWRLRIQSPSAYSLNFGFTQYLMPKGGKLFLYTADYTEVRGPFTPADNEDHEQLWTPLLEGDDLVIEVQVPEAVVDQLQLKLSFVNHAFQSFGALISGSCNLDVICGAADGWGIVDPHRDIIQSVAVISTGGGTFCTGFLVNNVEQDCTPFFMTANHCGINSGNAPSLVTYWNFQNSTCRQPGSAASGGPGDGTLDDFNTGSIFRASRSASDFTLVELDDPISPTANAYLAGWDASASPISSAIAIHHPRTDEKRISFENDATQFTTNGGTTPTANFTHVRVIDWDTGTTEPGSSGSPLFDQDERVVGQLHGGGAACGNNSSDWYGAFATSWDAGGSSSSRLRDWLDPNDTGTLTINGRWADDCGFSVSADPVSQQVCKPISAQYTISVSNAFPGTVSLSASGLPSGANANFSPGNVAPGGSSTLTVTTASVAPGTYTFTVTGSNGGNVGEIDLTLTVLAGSSIPPDLLSPADNSTNVFPNPVLMWDGDDSGATTYEVQISTNSNFTAIVETGSTTATSYQPTNANSGATTYYWRVRASNDCGTSGFSDGFSFVTQNISCITYDSNFSTTISEVGTPTVENDIFFDEDLTIASVTIGMEVTHTYVGDLDANLFPASGGVISLFDRPGQPNSNFGCSEDNLNLSFSANSPNSANTLENTCNPSDTGPNVPGAPYAIEGSYRPIGNLDNLIGENSMGSWTLQINDNASADGGILESWSVTVCYEIPSNPPFLVANEMLQVVHNTQEIITDDFLEAGDDDSGPDELVYTLTNMPNEGMLILDGQMLNLGDTFTQEDIDNGLLVYQHEGGSVLTDQFEFDLTNAAGLSITGNIFLIEIIIEALSVEVNQLDENDCNGDSNASIEVLASGGVAPYQYAINGGAFQESDIFDGLAAGSYFVTVMDMLGTETETNSFLIMQPDALSGMPIVDEDEIIVVTQGGTPPYTYQLDDNPSQAEHTFDNLPNGTYDITITDANNCTTVVTATVAVNTLSIVAALVQDISCHDANDGIITALADGGTPDYQYAINGGIYQSESTFTDLAAGSYIIEVLDEEGFTLESNLVTVSNPPLLEASVMVDESTITIDANGGTAPLMYQLNGGTPQSDPVFSGLSNGTYDLTVVDANGCEVALTATVAVNTLMVSADLDNDISCHNANDGTVSVNVSGGMAPYQYSIDGENYQSENTFTNLAAGSYTVTVLDNEGFTQTTNAVVVSNPTAISASAMVDEFTITIDASGGTAPLMYQLNGGTPQSDPVFSGLSNGTYDLTVVDANGCEVALTATVAVNTLVVSAVLESDISCHNANDGTVSVNVSGGMTPYQYSLDGENYQSENTFTNLAAGSYTVTVLDNEGFTQTTNAVVVSNPTAISASAMVDESTISIDASGGTTPLMYQLNGGTPQSDPVFSGLSNGTYNITVIDANGCEVALTATVAVNTLVVSAVLESDISCHNANDGTVSVNVSGGMAPYQYSIDGENYQSENTFTNLAAGSYTVTVLDNEGFTQTTNAVVVSNPTAISVSAMVDDFAIAIVASGGTAPLMYQLNDGTPQSDSVFFGLSNGTYNITVIDANGCEVALTATVAVNTLVVSAVLESDISCHNANDGTVSVNVSGGMTPYQYSLDGENYQSENTFTNLAAGSYTVTVLDNEGFTQTTNAVVVSNPTAISANATVEANTITVSASGGTAPLRYQLNGGTIQDSPVFSELPNGTYTLTVLDANNCSITLMATVAVNTLDVSAVLVNDISCFNVNDGSLSVEVAGGTPPYMYSLDGENFQSENVFTNLAEGTYSVVVLDAEDFTQITNPVSITNPALLMMSVTVDGSTIIIDASGGSGDLSYSIDGQNFQSEAVFEAVPDNIYQVSVRDANGCVVAAQAIVAVNSLLASIQVTNEIACAGDDDASILVTANGGISPYQYSLNEGPYQDSNVFAGLAPGDYMVTVEDATGTTFTTMTVTITAPEVLSLELLVVQDSITATSAGGTAPYTYSLDGINYQEDNVFPDLPSGEYTVWVLDARGCLAMNHTSILVGIFQVLEPKLELTIYPNPNRGQFRLSLQQETGQVLICTIYNAVGELIEQHRFSKPSDYFNEQLDLSHLPAGIYQLAISDERKRGMIQVIIMH